MATATTETDRIRQQMAKIRHELHEDVQGVVKGAANATDWRWLVRAYPWASLGLMFATGYLIVPKRKKSAVHKPDAIQVPAVNTVVVERVAEPQPKRGLLRSAAGWVLPIAWRAVQGYGMQYLSTWIQQQQSELAASLVPQGPTGKGPGSPNPARTAEQSRPGFTSAPRQRPASSPGEAQR